MPCSLCHASSLPALAGAGTLVLNKAEIRLNFADNTRFSVKGCYKGNNEW